MEPYLISKVQRVQPVIMAAEYFNLTICKYSFVFEELIGSIYKVGKGDMRIPANVLFPLASRHL